MINENVCRRATGHDRKQTRRGSGLRQCGRHYVSRSECELAVAVVDLVHDGAAGGQSRGRVAADDAEGEGKIGRPEDAHDAQGNIDTSDVGTRAHSPGVVGVVNGHIEVLAPGELVGEEAKLERRAGEFAVEPRLAEMGFTDADVDEIVGAGVECFGDRVEPGRPLGGGDGRRENERFMGRVDQVVCLVCVG